MLTVDEHQRVQLPDVEPKTQLIYEKDANGVIHLKKLGAEEHPPAKVRFVQENGYMVGTTDQPISLEAIKEALSEFP
jgi:hypothetical protein